jgi:hypothetical protein
MHLNLLAAMAVGLLAGPGDTATREVEKALGLLNDAFMKRDAEAIKRLMTPDHVAVTGYYGGPRTPKEQLKSLSDLNLTEYRVGNLKITPLSKDAVLVTYRVSMRGTFQGRAVPARNFVSAVWVRRGGRWRQAFYQETPLAQE